VGGIARKLNEDELKDNKTRPHIVIGTPGRLKDLAESGKLPLGDIKFFIVDECDKVLDQLGALLSLSCVFPVCVCETGCFLVLAAGSVRSAPAAVGLGLTSTVATSSQQKLF
jgi:DEAD/DEAH box helicase